MRASIVRYVAIALTVLVNGMAMAQGHTADVSVKQDTVVSYRGARAKAFFPAYIAKLKQDSNANDALGKAARRTLDTVTKNRVLAFQVKMTWFAQDAAIPVKQERTPMAFPSHPVNGATVDTYTCVAVASPRLFYKETNVWQYSAATRQWVAMRVDEDRVAHCETDSRRRST